MNQYEIRDFLLLHPGQYFTARQIAQETGAPNNSVTSRMKSLRKAKLVDYEARRVPKSNQTYFYKAKC